MARSVTVRRDPRVFCAVIQRVSRYCVGSTEAFSRWRNLVFSAALMLAAVLPAQAQISINEVDYDQPSTDATEFIELTGPPGASLAGWRLYLYNGAVPTAAVLYAPLGGVDLSAYNGGVMPGDGYLVIGSSTVTNVDLPAAWTTNGVQNGAPDGIALVNGATVVQYYSYEGAITGTTDGPAAGMATTLDMGTDTGVGTQSLSRCPDGCGVLFVVATSTPGTANTCPSTSCCIDADCNDVNPCTDDTCVSGTCTFTNNSVACDDGLYCNGSDVCSGGTCTHSGSPCSPPTPACDEATDACVQCTGDPDCSDGVGCTDDTCVSNSCVYTPNNANCDDGNPCNGSETCDAVLDCQAGTPITCPPGQFCDPGSGLCVSCTSNPDCADGNDCTDDICTAGVCSNPPFAAGTACGSPADTDCDNPDTCDGSGNCQPNNEQDNTPCPNADFCDGVEVCLGGVCSDGADPCVDLAHCDEVNDVCLQCLSDAECDDGLYCNGVETCVSNVCTPGMVPCSTGCDEGSDSCTGACCVAGFCLEGSTAANCTTIHGTFTSDALCGSVSCPALGVVINEIRTDEIGTDVSEYFELFGPPGTSLEGLTYIVIGDTGSAPASGKIEAIIPLHGLLIPADGHFLAVEDTFALGGSPDLVLNTAGGTLNPMNFENSDNVTHMLVAGFTGTNGQDLDTDNNCTLDIMPWAGVLDLIGIIEEPNPPLAADGECHYGPPTVGPDGTFSPGLAVRCPDAVGSFIIGEFDVTLGHDTPGAVNLCPTCGNGMVEITEDCDGGDCCGSDCKFLPGSTVCRASAGICDVQEFCLGNSADCPADEFVGAGTECRASAGVCDVAEACTGMAANCPADGFAASGECRASAGACDLAESCNGSGPNCPADALAAAGTSCRASAGVCDVAESCTGSSVDCPADGFAAAGTSCRASAGVCDVGESCTGSGPNCPADGFAPASQECRASAGPCDVAENCTGSAAACPADGFAPSSQVCRGSAGICDVAENCTGSGAACPADGYASGVECRAATGDCDVAESCNGSGIDCPADAVAGAGTVCRAATGEPCDIDEACDGTSKDCPADEPNTVCADGDGCCPLGCGYATDNDCEPIPTVSTWGLMVLALLLLSGAKIYFGRREAVA